MKTIIDSGSRMLTGILILFILAIAGTGACTKKSATLPVVVTENPSGITSTTAVDGGEITNDGGATIYSRGVCWGISPDPTISDSLRKENGDTKNFIVELTNLAPNTTYYVRAFATNSVGTAYGNQVTFTTPMNSLATLNTTNVSMITSTTASSGGNITSDGGHSVTSRGVCWSTSQNPTIANNITTNGSGTGIFVSNLTGLTQNTMYYLRAYATNSLGTEYGNQASFTTLAQQGANEVFIQSMAFNPVTITVSAGTTVKWTNKDAIGHTVTSDTNLFNSGTIGSGMTYSYTFSNAGTYNYHCAIHPSMTGTVIVN